MNKSTNNNSNLESDLPDGDEGETTMRLGVGSFGGDSSEAPPSLNLPKKINSGMLILGLTVLVAVGGLMSMRAIGRATGAVKGKTDVEKTIEEFLTTLSGSAKERGVTISDAVLVSNDGLLNVLTDNYTHRQVALTDVQRNPFILYQAPVETVTESPVYDDGAEANRQLKIRQDAARADFIKAMAPVKLKSVIMGSQPMANLSGKIVQVGEVIPLGETIKAKVLEISAESITIGAEWPELKYKTDMKLGIIRD